MQRRKEFPINRFHYAAIALLLACVAMSTSAQQNQPAGGSLVEDWSHHHMVFSNPGTEHDAFLNGQHEEWRRLVNDPRYRLQQIRRNFGRTETQTNSTPDLFADSASNVSANSTPTASEGRNAKQQEQLNQLKLNSESSDEQQNTSSQGEWAIALSLLTGFGVPADMYPAKFTFAPIGTPDCNNDFVVFPINGPGSAAQANIVGVNGLYSSDCSLLGLPVSNVLFAYNVGTGSVLTSPVLSLNGAKVAFVESIAGGSRFHVLTLDKRGSLLTCPILLGPCNGTGYAAPAVPGVDNVAVDVPITMNGGVNDSDSSPYIDYDNDFAYVGDDSGRLHKFTGVFNGTPTEVTTAPWPLTVITGTTNLRLTGPVFDSKSQKIFIAGRDNGVLYCVTIAGVPCSTPSVAVGSGIQDTPIVDSTNQTVFVVTNNSTSTASIVFQANTSLGNTVTTTIGLNGTDLYNGTFDNAYYTNPATGHFYACGNLSTSATPTLYRIGFATGGKMNATNDGSTFQLVASGHTGTGTDCSPISEIFNSGTSQDLIFLSVRNFGFTTGTNNCSVLLVGASPCLMSFNVTTGFPTAAAATATALLGPAGTSGIVIDNVSTVSGASQIYFGNLQASTGMQLSQAALR